MDQLRKSNVSVSDHLHTDHYTCTKTSKTSGWKRDENLVEQLSQQIEQLRNGGSAKDREIAEMRKQNADLQTALRGERQQTVNAHQQIVELRQRTVDLQRALRDEQQLIERGETNNG